MTDRSNLMTSDMEKLASDVVQCLTTLHHTDGNARCVRGLLAVIGDARGVMKRGNASHTIGFLHRTKPLMKLMEGK